ncbi:MAG: hypothetical protein HOP29_10780 [Phycisphaerales bacterium]|nr:hypothetical protein [Phycisphaerales bacterium]
MKSAILVILAIMLTAAPLSGCNVGRTSADVGYAGKLFMQSQNLGPTLTHSTADHMHTISAVIDRDTRALFDDLDILYMTDRPSRLTRWHDR